MSTISFFTEHLKMLAQDPGCQFGEIGTDGNQFRIGSTHTASSDPKAFAVSESGMLALFEMQNTNLLTIALKPDDLRIYGSNRSGLKIKYVIYKGIKKTSLTDTSINPAPNLRAKFGSGFQVSDYEINSIQSIEDTYLDDFKFSQKLSFTSKSPRTNGLFSMGNFDKDGFSVEIILDKSDAKNLYKIKDLRKPELIVDATNVTDEYALRSSVSCYCDVTAFYLVANNRFSVICSTGTSSKKYTHISDRELFFNEVIYRNGIIPFFTYNKIYIYYGESFSKYYQNSDFQVKLNFENKLGTVDDALQISTSKWPISEKFFDPLTDPPPNSDPELNPDHFFKYPENILGLFLTNIYCVAIFPTISYSTDFANFSVFNTEDYIFWRKGNKMKSIGKSLKRFAGFTTTGPGPDYLYKSRENLNILAPTFANNTKRVIASNIIDLTFSRNLDNGIEIRIPIPKPTEGSLPGDSFCDRLNKMIGTTRVYYRNKDVCDHAYLTIEIQPVTLVENQPPKDMVYFIVSNDLNKLHISSKTFNIYRLDNFFIGSFSPDLTLIKRFPLDGNIRSNRVTSDLIIFAILLEELEASEPSGTYEWLTLNFSCDLVKKKLPPYSLISYEAEFYLEPSTGIPSTPIKLVSLDGEVFSTQYYLKSGLPIIGRQYPFTIHDHTTSQTYYRQLLRVLLSTFIIDDICNLLKKNSLVNGIHLHFVTSDDYNLNIGQLEPTTATTGGKFADCTDSIGLTVPINYKYSVEGKQRFIKTDISTIYLVDQSIHVLIKSDQSLISIHGGLRYLATILHEMGHVYTLLLQENSDPSVNLPTKQFIGIMVNYMEGKNIYDQTNWGSQYTYSPKISLENAFSLPYDLMHHLMSDLYLDLLIDSLYSLKVKYSIGLATFNFNQPTIFLFTTNQIANSHPLSNKFRSKYSTPDPNKRYKQLLLGTEYSFNESSTYEYLEMLATEGIFVQQEFDLKQYIEIKSIADDLLKKNENDPIALRISNSQFQNIVLLPSSATDYKFLPRVPYPLRLRFLRKLTSSVLKTDSKFENDAAKIIMGAFILPENKIEHKVKMIDQPYASFFGHGKYSYFVGFIVEDPFYKSFSDVYHKFTAQELDDVS